MERAPLIELEESWAFGLWPRRLLVFEDRIEVRDFELLRERAESRRYGWIEEVVVSAGGWGANLLITGPGSKPVLIRGVSEDAAERARAMIEERMARVHDNHSWAQGSSTAVPETGRLIRGMAELRDAGLLSEEEFEAKRREVLVKEREPR